MCYQASYLTDERDAQIGIGRSIRVTQPDASTPIGKIAGVTLTCGGIG